MLRKKVSIALCLVLSLAMCLSMTVTPFAAAPASAAGAGKTDTEAVRSINTALHRGDPEMAIYSDSLFRGDSLPYNDSLATQSFVLCTVTQYTKNLDKPDLVFSLRQYMEDNGFSDFEASEDFYYDPMDGSSAPSACAHKKIVDNGKEYTLLAVVPKSGTRGSEYHDISAQSIDESDTGDYLAYAKRAESIISFTREYIQKYGISGDIKVWLTGYSGGGGTVQVLGANILRDPAEALGDSVKLDPSNFYCYAFSGVRVAPLDGDYADSTFDYIHNYCEITDLTANMHTEDIFARYGKTIPYSSRGDKDRMLELLKMDSPIDYEAYVSSGDPDDYMPLKFDVSGLKEGNLSMVPDEDSYLPETEPEYRDSALKMLAQLYARSGNGNSRVGYYKEYQTPMMAFSRAIDNDTYLFLQAMTQTKTSMPMILSMYITYMTDKSIRDKRNEASQSIEDAFNEMALIIEDADGNLNSEYSKLGSTAYTKLRNLLFDTVEENGTRTYKLKYNFNRTTENKLILKLMKRMTGLLFQMSFRTVFEANEIDEIRYTEFLDLDNCTPIAWLFTNLNFSNPYQTGAKEKFSFENEQFKEFATWSGNLNRMITPHNSSNIIEWLRSADERYDDYALPDAAQSVGYRRVYIDQKDGVSVSGEVADANGTVVAKFEGGKLLSSTDPWVSITSCDSGNWLRLPVDKDYKVSFKVSKDSSINLKVADYSYEEARMVRTVKNDNNFNWTGLKAKSADGYTLNIPAVNCEDGQYDLTSAYYSLSITKGEDPAGGDTGMPEIYSSSIPKVKGLKVTSADKIVTVKWKKLSAAKRKKYSRTEVQYSTDKKFSKSKTVKKEVSRTKTSLKIKNLKSGTKYYVRVRNLKYRNEKKIVSKWSSVKKVTVK